MMKKFLKRVLPSLIILATNTHAQTQDTTTTFTYDNLGNVKTISRPLGRTTSYEYDALSRVTEESVSLGASSLVTKPRYDGLGQTVSIIDPRDLVTVYTVDGLGNHSSLNSPDTKKSSYTVDEAGNLLSKVDARGKVTLFQYDLLGRLVKAQYQSGIASQFEYDGGQEMVSSEIGNLTKIIDESGSTIFTHDLRGRVLAKSQIISGAGADARFNVQYRYGISGSSFGKMETMIYPSGTRISYHYDQNGQVNSIALARPNLVGEVTLLSDIAYGPSGEIVSWKWGNSVLSTYERTYDMDGRLTSYPIDLLGNIRTITYDAANLITAYTHSTGANQFDQIFGYDTADRLTSFTKSGVSTTYQYDSNGNRTKQTGPTVIYNYDAANNWLRTASFPTPRVYTYDATGNRTSDGIYTYTYSDRGRLSSVGGKSTLSMSYNALGQRLTKAGKFEFTVYVYDEAGHTIGEYHRGSSTGIETVYLGDIPIAAMTPSDYFYIIVDQVGAPLVLTQVDGVIAWDWRNRDPFGNNAPIVTAALKLFSLRFPGQVEDVETGLFYNYFRDYDPLTGRYIQSDPLGLGGGVNTYSYVDANSLSFIDPDGLQVIPIPPPAVVPGIPGNPGTGNGAGNPTRPWTDIFKPSPYLPTWDFPDSVYAAAGKPPSDATDPNGAKAPGQPGESEGFCEPKKGPRWGKAPGGRGSGWIDVDGNVWVPTGQGSDAHGGPHWDVQKPGGGYINVYPGGKRR